MQCIQSYLQLLVSGYYKYDVMIHQHWFPVFLHLMRYKRAETVVI